MKMKKTVKVTPSLSDLTINIKVSKTFRLRVWLGTIIIAIGCSILGCKSVIDSGVTNGD
jgi:hypothetical protein